MQTPNEPFSQAPIPDPTGYTNSGNIVPPGGPAQINFDAISRAWESLKPTLGIWVVAFLIYGVITFGISFIVGLLTGGGARTMPLPMPGSGPAPGQFQAPPAVVMPNIPLLLIGNLVQFVISQFLLGGLYRMAINQVRGIAPSIGGIFSVADVLPALLGASILTALATFLGLLLCVIPGLLLSGLFLFTIPLVVDRKLGATEAMSTSLNTLKPQMWSALAFAIVIGLLAGAGALLCGVGVLITAPLAILSVAVLYRDFFPEPALA